MYALVLNGNLSRHNVLGGSLVVGLFGCHLLLGRYCVMFATIYEWKEEKFKNIFGSRLRGDPLEWHVKRLQHYPTESYLDWSNALKCHFQTEMDVERLEKRFFKLKQKPTEPVQYFIDKVIRKYNSIYGRHLLQTLGNDDVQRPKNQEDICLKIFLNGVRPDVKKAMFNSQFLDDHSWVSVIKGDLLAEVRPISSAMAAA